jgi:internalin A
MKTLTIVCSVGVLVLLPLAIVIGCAAPVPETVVFPDENLDAVIRDALDKPAEEAITPAELAGLTVLYATQQGITDLSCIEYCTNLTELMLNINQIVDIAPLASLTNLEFLDMAQNQISDLSPLASLTN